MSIYYYIIYAMLLLVTIWVIRKIRLKEKNLSYKLFIEALKSENNGHLEEAVKTYETALDEIGNTRFKNGLRVRIVEKLKLLHAIIEYKRNLHFYRVA